MQKIIQKASIKPELKEIGYLKLHITWSIIAF